MVVGLVPEAPLSQRTPRDTDPIPHALSSSLLLFGRVWHVACCSLGPVRVGTSQRPCRTLLSFGACAFAATVWGCSTTYQATAPHPVQSGNAQASVEIVRGTMVAEVRVPAADLPPESGRVLDSTRPGTPDLAFGNDGSGCARLPLTGTGRGILWHGLRGWGGSGHIRLEWPAASAAGIGAGVTAEMRFHHRLRGDWRLAFGLPFGWVGCRGDCPDWEVHANKRTTDIYGMFTQIGATVSVARVVAVGRWLFLPAVGFRTSAYHLGAPREFAGDRFAIAAGPFATLGILRAYREPPPGFVPAQTARRGIELSVGALGTYGRAPRDIAWFLGVGWVFMDVD